MGKRKSPYPEKPWKPDPVKWKKLLEDSRRKIAPSKTPEAPVGGWLLYRIDTLENVDQKI